MKSTKFAFVVAGATFVAFLVTLAVSSCMTKVTKPTCPCDWYAEHYSGCVKMCASAREWAEVCEYPEPKTDCVDALWSYGIPPIMCAAAAGCYEALTKDQVCGTKTQDMEAGWMPPLWQDGCPVEVGGE